MNRGVAIGLGCFRVWWLALFFHAAVHAQAKQGPAPAQFAYGGDAAQIPAEFIGRAVFLPVRLNQSKSSLFVLDSAAAGSSIDPERLSALGIAAAQAPILNLNGVDLPFSALPAVARPDFAPDVGRAYQGTLGGDFLQRVVVEIDYARQTVRLYDPAVYSYSGGGTAVRLSFADGLPVIAAKFTNVKGKTQEGNFVVDTMLGASTVIFDRYAQAHHLLSSHGRTIPSVDPLLNSAGGAVVGRLKEMQLASYAAQDTLVTFSRADLPGAADAQLAGAIGSGLLGRFTVVLDYAHQQLILAPNSRFPSDDQEDKSGISVVAKGAALKTFEVVEVEPGTPAAKAGIEKGDVIAGIDQDPAADLTLAEIRELFQQIGHKYTLVIDRHGQSRQITIEMKRQI